MTPPPSPPPAPQSVAAPTPEPLPAGVPDSAAGHQLAWVLGALASAPGEADVASHFAPEALAQLPAAKLVAVFGQLAKGSPYELEKVAPPNDASPELVAAVIRSAQGPRLSVHIGVEKATPNRIQVLLFRPVVDAKPAASWDEVQGTVRAVAPLVSFLAAELDGKKCVPLASIEPEKPLALGSAFKLYVLDALAAQIAAGKHGWDDPVPIRDALKSLPSGDMRNEPEGKTFSVRHFAEKMISVSDNTATDHLLALVGRTHVEGAARATGHAAPSRLVPFLSTREMFTLKLLATPDERSAYVAADVAHKRKLLEAYGQRDLAPAMAQAAGWTRPVMIDAIEWPASAEDVCRVMIDLHARADAPATAPIGAILSINPGIPDEKKLYRYVGFKGGSEPGVLNLSWLLQRARDGKWLFLSVGFNDTKSAIDESRAIAAATTARDFLGQ
ncbi:MAG TPA: serine hydrolase [Polyangiaceae bacterium]